MKHKDFLAKYEPAWARRVMALLAMTFVPLLWLCNRMNVSFVETAYLFGVWLLALSGNVLLARGAAYRRLMISMQRRDNIRCLVCDYDLQQNTSGVCPECGNRTDQTSIS